MSSGTVANFSYLTQCTTQFQANGSDNVALPGYSWINNTNTGLYNGGNNMIGLVTSGVERMRIVTGGNIGIGAGAITSPAASLHIAANTTSDLLLLNQTGTGNVFETQTNGTTKLIVNNTGNVGVGTTSATMQLHVYSTLVASATAYTPTMLGLLPMAILEEQITNGGGSSSIGATLYTRKLNTVITDSLGTSVALNTGTNIFTLPIGTYYITAEGSASFPSGHRLILSSVDTTININGTSEFSGSLVNCKSTLATILTLSTAKQFTLTTYSPVTTQGYLGPNATVSTGNNTYARIIIIRMQ